MIEIRPDPAHPGGGYAVIEAEGAKADEGAVSLTLFNSYTEQYLGEGGWQPTKVIFGPYPATEKGGGLSFVVGPEIVNFVTDDTPVRVGIGDDTFDTYWPDDVNQNPQAPVDKGKISLAAGRSEPSDTPVYPVGTGQGKGGEEPVGSGDDGSGSDLKGAFGQDGQATSSPEPPETPAPGPVVSNESSSKLPLVLVGLLLLAVAGAAAFWFLKDDALEVTEPEPEPVVEPEPDPEPETAAAPCSADTLTALAQAGFSDLLGQLRGCGAEVSADEALLLVEGGARQDDPDALSVFGALYDESVTEEGIEGAMGLTFPDNPARAAEYYSRAVTAGSTEAEARLLAVCRRLLLMSDTLSQGAHDDYCE